MQPSVSLADKSSLKVGGTAEYFSSVSSNRELAKIIHDAKDHGLHINILSGGTNTLVSEEGVSGLVIQPKILCDKKVTRDGEKVFVEIAAGEDWDEAVAWSVEQGFWGLENLSLIPGWVGASPYQNIGAYGQEVANIITEVHTYDFFDQKQKVFRGSECDFSYRSSVFKKLDEPRYVITAVTFVLSKTPRPNIGYHDVETEIGSEKPTLQAIRDAVVAIRGRKMPDMEKYGTAGSFWMNPVVSYEKARELEKEYPLMPMHDLGTGMKIPLAWILDNILNLKGYRKNNVSLYEHHPLVLITEPGANSNDVLSMQREVEQKVREATGITIEREVRFLGEKQEIKGEI